MRESVRQRTREKILDGAVEAVARHGLAKLDMADVSESAGVSRGTLYRYFRSRDDLLTALSVKEAYRFWDRCLATLGEAEGGDRIRLLLLQANRLVREHPALQRILDTDPALVLRAIQREFPRIRSELARLIGPLLADTPAVSSGAVGVDPLVDWITRLMISAYLIPASEPDEMSRGLATVYDLLTSAEEPDRG